MASFLHTIVLPKSSYPYTAFALSNYLFFQFWYTDDKDHTAKVTISDAERKNRIEVDTYTVPKMKEGMRVFQQTLILPRIVVSEPQAVWITTICDGKKIQEYPIEFLYK